MKFLPKQVLIVSFIAFVLSGFSGLIYQSIWTRYLSLVLGHAAFAQTLVLALFMGGMAFGAWWASKLSAKHGLKVLKTYAIIEIIVGIAAFAFHTIFVSGTEIVQHSILPNVGSGLLVSAAKWGWAALLILPQCILLGTTFPLLSAGLIRLSDKVTGEILGTLYFTNSIGAAVGALVATFMLIPAVGLPGAMMVAGAVNFVAGLLVLLVSIGEVPTPKAVTQLTPSSEGSSQFTRLVLICAFFTGLSSFVYEVAWVRMLALALGSTVHAFEIMISAFVAGLAFGSLWIRKRIDGQAEPLAIAAWAQILMGIAALGTIFSYKLSFYGVGNLASSLAPNAGGYALFNLSSAAIAMLIMLPTAFFAGMTLPVFTAALIKSGAGDQSIGRVYAANTIGAIAGVFLAVHLLLPIVGMKSAILIAALIDIALGIVIFRKLGWLKRPKCAFGATAGIVAVVAAALAPKLDEQLLVSGMFRQKHTGLASDSQIVYYRDGKTATISASLRGSQVSISTNGKVDAAVQMNPAKKPTPDEETMLLLGLMPSVYRPDATLGANIGFGSGLTTHILLGNPKLTSLDTIEIESAIVEGARVFAGRNALAYTDPRSKIIIDDAKTYFSGSAKKYDFIVSEPSNPWVSGVASLFSDEFYKFLPRHLNENGILVQWIQLYEIDFAVIASILKALGNNFSDYAVYLSNSSDLIIVAQHKGVLATPAANSPLLSGALKRHGLTTTDDVNFRYFANKKILDSLVKTALLPANSDFFPVVSHLAPKARFMGATPSELYELPHSYLPFAQLLSKETARAPQPSSISKDSNNTKLLFVSMATEIEAALLDSARISNVAFQEMRPSLALIQAGGHDCKKQNGNHELLVATIRVHAFLANYLPSATTKALTRNNLFNCSQQDLPAHFSVTQAFLLALAQRNLEKMAQSANQILDDPELNATEILPEMALCTLMIDTIKANRVSEGLAMATKYRNTPTSKHTRALRKTLEAFVGFR